MRGITTFIVMIGLFSLGLMIAIPTMDGIVPMVTGMETGGMDGTIRNIHAAVVKWSIPTFFFTMVLYAVFWILRQEKQQVR